MERATLIYWAHDLAVDFASIPAVIDSAFRAAIAREKQPVFVKE
jgi:thiamine pyrophosphate-dependent acetolactate synthase large subunit-like protein